MIKKGYPIFSSEGMILSTDKDESRITVKEAKRLFKTLCNIKAEFYYEICDGDKTLFYLKLEDNNRWI